MVVGRQGSVRGQETMKSAGARALSKQGEPQEGQGPRQTQKQTHIHLHPNTPADALPFTQWGKKNLLCPVKTHQNLRLQNLVCTPATAFLLPSTHSSPTKNMNMDTHTHTHTHTAQGPTIRQTLLSKQSLPATLTSSRLEVPSGSPAPELRGSSEPRGGDSLGSHGKSVCGFGGGVTECDKGQHKHRENDGMGGGWLVCCRLPSPTRAPCPQLPAHLDQNWCQEDPESCCLHRNRGLSRRPTHTLQACGG